MAATVLRLTLYPTVTNFDAPEEKSPLKTLWEKEKMPVTTNKSSSPQCFKPSQRETAPLETQ